MMLDFKEAMIAWTPKWSERETAGSMTVGPHPDPTGWSKKYLLWVGASKSRRSNETENCLQMMLEFHAAVVRDGIDPKIAHREFSKIKQYREVIAEDIPLSENKDRTWNDVSNLYVVKSEADRIFGLKVQTCDRLIRVGILSSEFVTMRGEQAFPLYRIGAIQKILDRNEIAYRNTPPHDIAARQPFKVSP